LSKGTYFYILLLSNATLEIVSSSWRQYFFNFDNDISTIKIPTAFFYRQRNADTHITAHSNTHSVYIL